MVVACSLESRSVVLQHLQLFMRRRFAWTLNLLDFDLSLPSPLRACCSQLIVLNSKQLLLLLRLLPGLESGSIFGVTVLALLQPTRSSL